MTVTSEAPGVAPLNLSEAGSWLCSQDADLRDLVDRIGKWSNGQPEMAKVRDAVVEHDRLAVVRERNRAAGASFQPFRRDQQVMLRMTPGEVNRLRMLATLAPRPADWPAVQFSVFDLMTFNSTPEGKALVLLYLDAVRIGLVG